MPQASDELRAEFGIDDGPVIRFLEAAGYTQTRDWEWEMPAGPYVPTDKESRAIRFLIDEWDWGGLTQASFDRMMDGIRAVKEAERPTPGDAA